MHRLIAAITVLAPAAVALSAQTYVFTIDTRDSFVDTSLSLGTPLAGTFKGNYDATNNPTGTKTIPGLFGGSGNNPINYSATLAGAAAATTPPTGGFTLAVDLGTLTATIDGLAIDLLGGDTINFGVTVTIEYDTFHTQNPGAVFPGGFTIPIPLGDLATIDALTATQTAPGAGVLAPGAPGIYTLVVAVPVDLVASATVNGSPVTDGTPIPAVLPLTGTLDLTQLAPTLTLQVMNTIEQTTPIDAQAFTDQPLDIPTVLPPGGTAHLLFSGTITEFTISADTNIDLTAVGTLQCGFADLNCDGVVNGADLGLLLGQWGPCGAGECSGDLNGDGEVNGADLGLLLGAWS
ncbi:MAG: dockerin type I repeat-containing protein [Phycisphaerales bacterium]